MHHHSRVSFVLLVSLGLCVVLVGGPAGAQSPTLSPAARQEAAERFDRGLRLFNQGENAGALVEFKRTYELTGDPSTLFNIGLVYAELKRPVEAVDAFNTLLKSSAKLGPEQRQKAEKVRAEQQTFVSFVDIGTNVQAMIEVDGVEASHTPLSAPLRLAAGHHVVGAVAAGYAPSRKTIDIAGGETQKLSFDLVPRCRPPRSGSTEPKAAVRRWRRRSRSTPARTTSRSAARAIARRAPTSSWIWAPSPT
jgi:hypothetical protein